MTQITLARAKKIGLDDELVAQPESTETQSGRPSSLPQLPNDESKCHDSRQPASMKIEYLIVVIIKILKGRRRRLTKQAPWRMHAKNGVQLRSLYRLGWEGWTGRRRKEQKRNSSRG